MVCVVARCQVNVLLSIEESVQEERWWYSSIHWGLSGKYAWIDWMLFTSTVSQNSFRNPIQLRCQVDWTVKLERLGRDFQRWNDDSCAVDIRWRRIDDMNMIRLHGWDIDVLTLNNWSCFRRPAKREEEGIPFCVIHSWRWENNVLEGYLYAFYIVIHHWYRLCLFFGLK